MATNELSGLAPTFASATNDMLSAILDQSADCIKIISSEGTVDYMNRNGQCAMEIDDFCAVAGQPWTSLWPDEARTQIKGALEKARSGQQSRFEAFCPTAKGTPRWWEVSISSLRRPDGGSDGYITTSRDITDRVNQRALRDAMADEMRHRLRNNYAVVGSLLNAYSNGKPEQQAFVKEMINRLTSLGIAQTLKAEDGNICVLNELVPALLESYATPNCPIIVGAMPEVSLSQAQVDALALVLGELAVNSIKHGALSAHGTVGLAGKVSDGVITLSWSETSDRRVANREREGGQGLRLMSRVLASRSGGIDYEWAECGLQVTIRMAD